MSVHSSLAPTATPRDAWLPRPDSPTWPGNAESDYAWRYGRTFVWQRRSCDSTISDCGPYFGPADDTQSEALS